MKKKLASFIIPCYRSQDTVGQVVAQIKQTVAQRGDWDYEIIMANDGSPDNVFEVMTRLALEDERVTAVDLANNFGQSSATLAALSLAKGDVFLTLDDDGQCPPQYAFELIDKLSEGYDVAVAQYDDKHNGLFRRFGSAVNEKMLEYLVDKPANLHISSYLAFTPVIRDSLLACSMPNPLLDGYVLRSTNKIANVTMPGQQRISGKSGYTLSKLATLWMSGFTAFSIKPLQLSSFLGAFTALLGFVFGVVTIVRKLVDPTINEGYSSIVAILLFIGGMILFVLGLMGEYIGRTYMCVNSNPQYVIRSVVRKQTGEDGKKA